ncbi:MAG: hypothetical protein A2Y57_02055 [Candidatus Woykebacteria bacterium RBG_13_40_7b]|uniref:DUF1761 domain-containing protein n=1 Tax=Candidatus Woykebacteria bacterium RBG_13_40_7b TaxID=1802594 RepID=A0A1G1WAB5_9BACT|nr:MAG: hypothetical protein A2Y57_02055 [Candidatus Woykebacteria bacterium RBG_13_40_7b]
MVPRSFIAGTGATIVGLLVGGVLGTYGGWTPLLDLANTLIGSWIIAITLGVILVYLYGYLGFVNFLPGTAATKGVIYGLLVWVLLLIIGAIAPYFKDAVYTQPVGTTLFNTAILHIVWGSVLGYLYEQKF